MRITQLLLTILGVAVFVAGCSTGDSRLVGLTMVGKASNNQQIGIAYSYQGDAILAVATWPEHVHLKCGLEAVGSHDVPAHLALVTPQGKEDITRSKCWYDIREDDVRKYQLGNISVGTVSNFVYSSDDFSRSNFLAWQHKQGSP